MYEKQIRYVMTVANEGSFSRAADMLHIAQPSLSQYIKKIETQLGVELFDRSSGIVRLTDAGRVYIESGRQILDLERQMASRLDDLSMSRSGTVRVGISAHRNVCLMPPVVKAFRQEYPGVTVILDERERSALMDAVEHGEFDLCVTTLPVDTKLYEVEPLFREALMLAVPKDSAICRQLEASVTDGKVDITLMNGCDFAMLNETHLMQRQLEMLIDRYGLRLNRTVECTSLEALNAMVGAGMGAAVVPACIRNCGAEGVAYFGILQEVPKRDIVVIYRKNQYLSGIVQAFKECMKRILK